MRVSAGHRDVSCFCNGVVVIVHVIHLISSNVVLITNIVVFSNEALKHNAIHPRQRCRTLTLCLYLASHYDNMKQNGVFSWVLEEILVLKYLD